MKTKLLTLSTILLFCLSGFAQKTYLKVTKSNEPNDYVMYPPGTKFELKTKEGYIVFKNSDDPGSIDIEEKYILYVYPNWKDEAEILELTEGKVEKLLTYKFRDSRKTSDVKRIHNHGVTASSNVTNSKTIEDKKNLEFVLSNGIKFTYKDGVYNATLNEEKLAIKYNYIIYSDLGTLKLSFNSNNGKVWWIFEPVKY
ncbi:hypothetical protein [Winogradskyella haliclonae]|uniref:Uncharacterized protein n=1 Tax=Winogradskyella haliclonae TaxID=2048558 RepID=A0ABQ2BZP2_9FLAO|nr:hypothetical protein [Winogradskyella haliclonae]GGI57966.1 hypothetical protein GCM10011444_22750 [Winogradskyella haliclonae]